MLTKGAIGNLVNRYRAVLKKCHLINVFGSLAVASMLIMDGAGTAVAAENIHMTSTLQNVTIDAEGKKTYGDVSATGDIIVFDASKPAGSQAYDIEAGNITAGGTIKAGEITTYGNLAADHVETFANTDNTLPNNQGSVTVNGAVNLPGNSTTGRRFDIYNTVGSHNMLGNVQTGACIGLAGNGTEKSTLTGGVLAVGGGSFTVVNGMQAAIDEVSFNIRGRKARVHGDAGSKVASILDLNKFIMYKGHFIADASWDSQYSMAVIRSISPDDTRPGILIGDGHIVVGANSMVGLGEGATLDGLYGLMKTYTGYETPTKEGVQSVLALNSPLEIQNGYRVFMDGERHTEKLKAPYNTGSEEQSSLLDAMTGAGTFTQGANTMLVINGDNDQVHYTTDSKARASLVPGAISYAAPAADGDAKIEAGAKLVITGAQAGETYVVLGDGFDKNKIEFVKDGAGADTAWQGVNLLPDNPLVSLARGDDGTVAGEAKAAAQALPGLDSGLTATIDNANLAHQIGMGEKYYDDGEKGTQFLSRALRTASGIAGYGDTSTAVDTINEVSRASVTAGVQNTSLHLADAASHTVLHHLSLGNFDSGNSMHKDGLDIWATPIYGNTYTHGMGVSGASVRGNYGGIALGVDTRAGEIAGGGVRMGVAVNGGGGKSETRGTATSTDNQYNFGGVNLYAGWNLDNLNVLASLGYSMGNHDITMNLPASMGMEQAKADVDTSAFTADLRAEYQIRTNRLDILPHAGVRYTALHTDSHNLKVNGSTLNNVKSDTQNIVQFPVGVTVTRNIDVADWNVKPQADVSVIPAAGDKKANTRVKFSGTDSWSNVNTRIMDSTSWAGMLGIQAEKGNLAIGLNYGVQASRHETDQRVNVGISWKF